jgi:hypothetical protein
LCLEDSFFARLLQRILIYRARLSHYDLVDEHQAELLAEKEAAVRDLVGFFPLAAEGAPASDAPVGTLEVYGG